MWNTILYSYNLHNIIYQLYFDLKKKEKGSRPCNSHLSKQWAVKLSGNRTRTYSTSIPYPKSGWNWQKNTQWNSKIGMYQWLLLPMDNTVSTQTLKINSKGNIQLCKTCQLTPYNNSTVTAIIYGDTEGWCDNDHEGMTWSLSMSKVKVMTMMVWQWRMEQWQGTI